MVCRLTLLLTFCVCNFGQAGVGDTFAGPAEPAYVQAVAPRFIKWSFQNFEIAPTAQRTKLTEFILKDGGELTEWAFNPLPEFPWPRLQLGLRFLNGGQTDAFLFIFPSAPEKSFGILQAYLKFPAKNKTSFIGYGVSLRRDEYFIFNADLPNQRITQTYFLNGKKVRTESLKVLDKPKAPEISFAPLVSRWRGWYDEQDHFVRYELTLDKFNTRFLDGAAVGVVRKVNSEFLMNNTRINYKAINDYDILYP